MVHLSKADEPFIVVFGDDKQMIFLLLIDNSFIEKPVYRIFLEGRKVLPNDFEPVLVVLKAFTEVEKGQKQKCRYLKQKNLGIT